MSKWSACDSLVYPTMYVTIVDFGSHANIKESKKNNYPPPLYNTVHTCTLGSPGVCVGGGGDSLYKAWYRRAAGIAPFPGIDYHKYYPSVPTYT